jgi:hypothetical protein
MAPRPAGWLHKLPIEASEVIQCEMGHSCPPADCESPAHVYSLMPSHGCTGVSSVLHSPAAAQSLCSGATDSLLLDWPGTGAWGSNPALLTQQVGPTLKA